MLREIDRGIDATRVQAGITGEIGLDETWVSRPAARPC
jgi:predicted metal-dependent phosphotriesterase family hydrolase